MKLEIEPLTHVEYRSSHKHQKELVAALKSTPNHKDKLLLVEHPPTYTFGKSADHNNLLVNDEFLKSIGAKAFEIERGGDITYHGPGQLVGYPILNLKRMGIGVRQYVHQLEESIIKTVAHYGVLAYRIDGQVGLWVDQEVGPPKKIAAIGIKVSQGITMHGFALNVNTDLNYFNHIVPCGITDKGVTSIQLELGHEVSLDEVSQTYTRIFKGLFY